MIVPQEGNLLINGDCLDVLKELEDNSIDSIVTDPPYGLSFMGKKWDYDVPSTAIREECLRVLKPGGHLLAFAGTRTQHRMAVNIEDAGFEIRDMIAWVYGSGFPKSHNIGKAVDKLQGNEREIIERPKSEQRPNATQNREGEKVGKFGMSDNKYNSKGNSPREGRGTALKPALEPITVARKPLGEKTIAKNVLKYGTGGINIDGCRVGTKEKIGGFGGEQKLDTRDKYGTYSEGYKTEQNLQGRFPANFIHDGSDEVVELFPGEEEKSASRFFYVAKSSKKERNKGLEGFEEKIKPLMGEFRDNPGRSTPKSSPTARANHHPTVKPVKLMQYLVRLVTPKGATCLDPFMGSGTTGIACKLEGVNFVGIEREGEYIEIARARIEAREKEEDPIDKQHPLF